MKCPEPSIKEPYYFCYNGECYATHWYECSKGFRKQGSDKAGIIRTGLRTLSNVDRTKKQKPFDWTV